MKLSRFRVFSLFMVCGVCCAGTAGSNLVAEEISPGTHAEKVEPTPAVSSQASDASKDPKKPKASRGNETEQDFSCVSGAALEDLSRQRESLEAREKDLAAKEAELRALEQSVREELGKLEQARAEIAKANELGRKENEGKVAKIVETVESMSPKPAAALVASLDDSLAITAMQRISTPKLAKIMNVMEPRRSSRLTELLAGVVRAGSAGGNASRNPASPGAEGPRNTSAKGGENHDGQSESNSISGKKRQGS